MAEFQGGSVTWRMDEATGGPVVEITPPAHFGEETSLFSPAAARAIASFMRDMGSDNLSALIEQTADEAEAATRKQN